MSGKLELFVGVLAAICSTTQASVPEGLGSVDFGVGCMPYQALWSGSTNPRVSMPPWPVLAPYSEDLRTNWGTQLELRGDFPLGEGISMGLGAGVSQQTAVLERKSEFIEFSADDREYSFFGALKIYPAGFLERPFRPGLNANADGWLFWPSATLQYGIDKTNILGSENQQFGSLITYETNTYVLDQTAVYGLVLPLQTWLTMQGSYYRSLQQDTAENYSEFFAPTPHSTEASGRLEGEKFGLTLYLNLIQGAGSDKSRPFLPHLGRLGQLALGLGWARDLNLENPAQVSCSQTYSMTVGAPLTANFGLTFQAAQTEPDHPNNQLDQLTQEFRNTPIIQISTEDRDIWIYNIVLNWSFGSPEHRVND